MENAAPTLLLVGYADEVEVPSTGVITITLEANTVNTRFEGVSCEDSYNRNPPVTGGKPAMLLLEKGDISWSIKWTMDGQVFPLLFSAAKRSQSTGDFNAIFSGMTSFVREAGIDSAREVTPIFWNTISVAIPSTVTNGVAGSAYFNLEYTAFDGLAGLTWTKEKPQKWIIRNGINDEAQNAGTTFKKDVKWEGTAADTPNGNGAVAFKIQSINFVVEMGEN